MTRTLATLALAAGLLLTGCSSDNLSGDSNPDSQSETPAPAAS